MSSKIIVEELQVPGGPVFKLPEADGVGPVVSDGSGNLTVQTSVNTYIVGKVFDFTVNNVSALDVLWTDIEAGISINDIAFVNLKGAGVSSSSACQLYFYGKDVAGSNITTGYLGSNHFCKYGSSSSNTGGVGSNSDNGNFFFPQYASAAQTGYSYGSGINFDAIWHLKKDGTYGNYGINFNGSYQQNTSYAAPNVEMSAWDNYSTSSPPETAAGGFRMYPSAGTLDRGFLLVELILK